MAGDKAGSSARTPARPAPKKAASVSSSTKQRSIVSFFQKSSPATATTSSPAAREKVSPDPQRSSCLQETTKANSLPKPKLKPSAKLSTPVPSSDALEPPSSPGNENASASKPATSPTTMTSELRASHLSTPKLADDKSPSRKVRSVTSSTNPPAA